MALLRDSPSLKRTLLIFLFVFLQLACVNVNARHQHGHHQHHHRKHVREVHDNSSNPKSYESATGNSKLSPDLAKEQIMSALKALSVVNRLRLQNIRFNTNEFANVSSRDDLPNTAPPLDLDVALEDLTVAEKRWIKKRKAATGSKNTTETYSYSIPDELREAARLVAELSPPETPQGDHESIAAKMRKKYALKTNDTNVPKQSLVKVTGLEGNFPFETVQTSSSLDARDTAAGTYWMANMEVQRGSSPYAPTGYKVWRNVKDFGAKGDGVTDDTAAINLAISSGGRCGANCGSSTIHPAVVYFPPGTYLVSSSIIQYYNTQFLGDPHSIPTILAAWSFVGLGVITSDVYISDNEQWYINQNNFLRSIKNFKIDIRNTFPDAYICGIHWQVAQGTSLENIEFYALTGTTQQGIYMENGSGGFLSDLIFVGGNFGAYFGNQQFTTSHLVFVNCNNALQVHWDWAWTMVDIIIEGLAGGPASSGQPVGSLIIMDSLIANTPVGIKTSLLAENSTALLVQNTGFYNVERAIIDVVSSTTLVNGGNEVLVENWGFGFAVTEGKDASSAFMNGVNIPVMNRTESLLAPLGAGDFNRNFFTRRRPTYYDIGRSEVLDVKSYGAKGDGVTDDTAVLNSCFQLAGNLSAIVYIPHGVYIIKDTLKIPVGSRVIGQAWSQIMATGAKFESEASPHVAVQVGQEGDVGIIEIQDLMFTVRGKTSGAVIVEWNVHESTQGSAGMWDTHIRVGGAIGSNLQKEHCPTGAVNRDCMAASLLLHLTPKSSAYIENSWIWIADHDLDKVTQDKINIFAARGVLIESQGPTWLYGTASEHAVLYQYQLSGAKDIFMAMIQTESPYFQSTPKAPAPFKPGYFRDDPTFEHCPLNSDTCAVSWAVRIVDSQTVYILGAGLYSFFSKYNQACLTTENCQDRGFEIEQSHDVWIYNLCTKAMVEMISPVGENSLSAADNQNGFLASILAYVRPADETIGNRNFTGFQLYEMDSFEGEGLSNTCKTALLQTIKCDGYMIGFQDPGYRGSLDNAEQTASVCDTGCGASLKSWYDNVASNCRGHTVRDAVPTKQGGTIWAGYNETCFKDATGRYCNDIIDEFTLVDNIKAMPKSELCSFCNVQKLKMMQSSRYSYYDNFYKQELEYIYANCPGTSGPTDLHPPLINTEPEVEPFCLSGEYYTTVTGDTCDSVASTHQVASASLFTGNSESYPFINCAAANTLKPGLDLCLPLTCTTYSIVANDTCISIERSQGLRPGDLRKYNPWIDFDCVTLHDTIPAYGRVLCISPQGGAYDPVGESPGPITPPTTDDGYTRQKIPPPANSTVAPGTTMLCGKWHTMVAGESCASICSRNIITSSLFLASNPSLTEGAGCTGTLVVGHTYCVGPVRV
ncbi:pectin lyase-like protein [Ascobolus immersus RN42]|uniref:Pectin lyase-like protein n=1 Tax=Ascobolus immersus RN42 TaxID=1160509 RepID=A0A3N4I4G2_ASCIM|nr:pectin lyase-like protein [Ascobolus immersus RN42]